MSWKKYFKAVDTTGNLSPVSGMGKGKDRFAFRNYQSRLPEVYSGHPNRVNRYNQYEAMDMDSEISACLDIISEFSTQSNEQNNTPFDINYQEKPTDNEVKILEQQLRHWCKLNQFSKRIFKLFRNTMKYGDQVFVRDPETFELFWVDMSKVNRVIVNESKGKEPDQYVIQDINPNFEVLNVATKTTDDFGITPLTGGINPQQQMANLSAPSAEGTRFGASQRETTVDAKHIVHLSLTEGLDLNWPFGTSILENIFKVFKQKELLEDAILIYRVQRAPERRVFYIDVGNMPSHMAMSFVERVKNEIHQRRIPTKSGGGDNMLDATYNPLCIDLATEIPLLDGRTLTLSEIISEYNDGKENWVYSSNPINGEIVPGKVKWAGETRKNATVIKLHLDNGETLTCTPDHKIPVLGKGFVEAKDLKTTDSLISFERKMETIDKSSNKMKYEKVFDHNTNEWIFTHKMVANNIDLETFIYEDKYKTYNHIIHHKDFDKYNNSPNNLCMMNKGDHIKYHASMSVWNTHPDVELIKQKISKTVTENWKNKPEHEKKAYAIECGFRNKQSWVKRKQDKETYQEYLKLLGIRSKQKYIDNPKLREANAKRLAEVSVKFNNQGFVWTQEMVSRLVSIVKEHDSNRLQTIELANNDEKLMALLKEANKPQGIKGQLYKIDTTKFTNSKLGNLYKQYNFKNWKDFKAKVPVYNHKIIKIEILNEKMDTGCLNVDNVHHTFAIKSGIYIKNSMNEDYFFPQCLSQSTKIPLLDGRTLTLQEVIDEYNTGKINYAYSLNLDTQALEPGKITWGGITRKDAKLVRVTLDNGNYIDATPDHRFILRDGTECQAQNLKNNDSLMPLYLKKGKTSPKQKNNGYMRYIDNGDGKTKWVHTAVCPKTEQGKKYVIHHKDLNSENNNPENLVEMLSDEHIELHKKIGTFSLQKQWNNKASREKLVNGIRKYHKNTSDADKQMMVERGLKNGAKTWERPASAKKVIRTLKQTQKRLAKQKTIQISDEMFERLCELYNDGFTSISKICPKLRNDTKFQQLYTLNNPNILRDKNKPKEFCPTDRSLHKIVQVGGYKNWSNFKEEYEYNHKVVSVEILPYTEDTCDITVESPSNSHIFATDAGVYVHNSAEGRGSKVDTLPGGENLGQIDDLRYFNNKLARGLRVPSSYLPSGPEDNAAPLNDGRLGTALIQEYRFNQYCIRLQNAIGEMLNKEFKMFLSWRGFNIDASLFDIQFGEPQNFASYRQTEQDASRVGTFSTLEAYPYLSKRFLLERYLGLTEEEMTKNDELWAEENKETEEISTEGSDLRGVGVMPGGMEGDIGMADELDAMGEMPEGEMDMGMEPEGGAPVMPTPPPV